MTRIADNAGIMNPLELQVLAAVSGIGGVSAAPQTVREPLQLPTPRVFPQPPAVSR